MPFGEETDILLKHWEFCYERSIGCVGNLRLMLVRAVHAALWADAKLLSWNHLKTHGFREAESYEMMREAYEGESRLASNPTQRAQLRKMLGLASPVKSKKGPQPDFPQDEITTSEMETTQSGQSDAIAEGVEQVIPSAEVSADEVSSELQSGSGNRSDKTNDRTGEENEAEDAPPSGTPPRPLKKPRAEPIRPFRRKTARDSHSLLHVYNARSRHRSSLKSHAQVIVPIVDYGWGMPFCRGRWKPQRMREEDL